MTSKILAVTDALGYLVRFVILPGQAHDLAGTRELLEGLPFEALIGDRAFDADWLIADVKGRGAVPVIPSKRNRKKFRDHDREMYEQRFWTENFFAGIKEFQAAATRYDKADASLTAAIHPVVGIVAVT